MIARSTDEVLRRLAGAEHVLWSEAAWGVKIIEVIKIILLHAANDDAPPKL